MNALIWALPGPNRPVRVGAPELKAASRQFLTRALLIAACAHLMSIAGARVLSGWLGRPAPIGRVDIITSKLVQRDVPTPQPSETRRSASAVSATDGLPEVSEVDARVGDETWELPKVADAPTGTGGTEEEAIAPPDVDRIPSPDAFVLFEEEPIRISMPTPVYPEMARQAGVEGYVVVLALIGKNGEVREARIDKGSPLFDDAALAAVRRSTWKPALNNNTPMMVWVRIPIRFHLN